MLPQIASLSFGDPVVLFTVMPNTARMLDPVAFIMRRISDAVG